MSRVALTLALVLAWPASPALAQDDGGESGADETPTTPPQPAASPKPPPLDELLWLDRSSSLLTGGASAITASPTEPGRIFAAGRGFVVRSTDGGTSWRPVLLLVGSAYGAGDIGDDSQSGALEVDDDLLERFELDDSQAVDQFRDMRADLIAELEERYGEEFAQSMIEDLEGDLREEAFADLIDEATQAAVQEDYRARYERLVAAGFAEEEASALASDPLSVLDLHIPEDAPETVFAATGLGLYRSLDGGDRWERLLQGFDTDEGGGVLSVATQSKGSVIVAATTHGLQISNDGGRTWQSTVGDLARRPVQRVVAADVDGRFFAEGVDDLHRTDDGGLTWISLDVAEFDVEAMSALHTVPGWSETLLATTEESVFRSDDSGRSWTDVGRKLPQRNLVDVVAPTQHPDVLLVLAQRTVHYTTDGGATWQDASRGLLGQELEMGAVGPGPESIFLATQTGVLRGLLGEEAVIQAETVAQLERIWSREPSPAQTVEAALIYHGLDDIPVDAWHAQRVASRFGPRVWVGFEYQGQRRDRTRVDSVPLVFGGGTGVALETERERRADIREDFTWEVMAMLDLGRLIYDPLEHTIERAGQSLRRERRDLVERIVKLVIARRALQFRIAADRGHDLDRRVESLLQLEEATALLDGLTGGYFTAAMVSRTSGASTP